MTTCKNCNHTFEGNFCPNCGQAANTHSLSFAYFWHEIQHGVFHVDKGILYTTKELFTRPGYAIKEYISGKRVKHFKPFAYIFIISSLYAVVAHFLKIDIFLSGVSTEVGGNIKITNTTGGDISKIYEILNTIKSVVNWIETHYAYTNLLMLPFFALGSYLVFRKSNYNYFEHLILNTYLAGQRTVVFLFLLPLIYFVTDKQILDTIDSLKYLLGFGLLYWTFNQFFESNKWYKNLINTLKFTIFLFVLFIVAVVSVVLLITVSKI